jgi:hypothetical protein
MSRKYILLLFIVLKCSMAEAQIVMSSIGMMGNASSTINALNFKSSTTCIDVQSGVAVLNGQRGNGQFTMNCEVTMKINSLGVRLFPNPVNHITKIKLNNTPPLTETFSLSIWTTEGALIRSQKETGYNLFQGLNIDLSGLTNGAYILKIESQNYMDAIKFIKAN